MIYFSSRSAARQFAKNGRKVVDMGIGRGLPRWAVKAIKNAD